MTISVVPTPPTVADLESLYTFRDPPEVAAFLTAHPHLVPLLVEVRPVIARYFPADTRVVLEIIYDYETGNDELTELFAFIEARLSPGDARSRLDRFDDFWWLSNHRRSGDRLQFDVRSAKKSS